jgi:dTDP-4-dehydrorhamnose reductase
VIARLPRMLVFGRNGQVGSELVRVLQGRRWDLRALDRHDCDLTVAGAATNAIRQFKPEVIINAAAYTAVDRAESERGIAERINAEAVAEMALEAKASAAMLIHYSTDYVFDGVSARPWTEDDPTNPVNAYGHSKLHGEEAIRKSGVKAFIFRTSWVYGAHGSNFVATMLKLGAEREELSVVSDQCGAPTSARELAQVAIHAIARVSREDGSLDEDRVAESAGLYHASAAGQTTWSGFAEKIFAEAQSLGVTLKVKSVRKITSEQWPTPAQRPKYSVLNNDRLRTQLAFKMPLWSQPLRDVVRDIASAKRP